MHQHHPPRLTPLTTNETLIPPPPQCKATNKPPLIMRYTLDLMGEMSHADHHKYPRCVQRALLTDHIYLFIYILLCVCVHACVCEREKNVCLYVCACMHARA